MNDPKMPVPTFGVLILAGGRSSRMGTDKAGLPFRGRTLLNHMRALAGRAGAAVVLTGGGPRADIPDPVSDAGPAAGLCGLSDYVAKRKTPERWAAVPVDMPRLETGLLRRLVAGPRAAFIRDHPLPLALTVDDAATAVLEQVKERLLAGESMAVWHLLDLLGAAALDPAPDELPQLINANTPQEWRRVLQEEK